MHQEVSLAVIENIVPAVEGASSKLFDGSGGREQELEIA